MMTNEEKYPKTEDALAAFKKHKEEHKYDCTFDKWLKMPCDDDIKKAVGGMPIGMSIMGMLAASIFANRKRENKIDGIECPLCHKKNGRIQGIAVRHFMCPDCKAFIVNSELDADNDAFVKWFSGLTSKRD